MSEETTPEQQTALAQQQVQQQAQAAAQLARTAELDRLQREKATLIAERDAATQHAAETRLQLADVVRERDTFRNQITPLETKAKLADELGLKVAAYQQTEREGRLLDELAPLLPGGNRLIIKGTLAAMHDAGKANRFAEDPKAEAAKVVELVKAEAPQLLRPLTSGGGSNPNTVTIPNQPKPAKRGLL